MPGFYPEETISIHNRNLTVEVFLLCCKFSFAPLTIPYQAAQVNTVQVACLKQDIHLFQLSNSVGLFVGFNITNCTYSAVTPELQGGALFAENSLLAFIDMTFENNSASSEVNDLGGAAVYLNGSANFTRCNFFDAAQPTVAPSIVCPGIWFSARVASSTTA